ncbi:Golgin-45 [Aphelenchoides bicaudatus]|nr:Golgin-45 [Aphelenchoides bicaudatus]
MTGTDKLLKADLQQNHRLIEWEPYKGACSRNFQKQSPFIPAELVAYQISSDLPLKCRPDFLDIAQLTESLNRSRQHNVQNPNNSVADKQDDDESTRTTKELQALRRELEIEREINHELKRLLVNALSEDINCKLSSLAEDKVRLAKNIDTYYNRERNNAEVHEQLEIENILWKSKFMAIAVRADDLSYNLNQVNCLLTENFSAQTLIADLSKSVHSKSNELGSTIYELLNIDVLSLYNKSPCDERTQKQPFASNLTINCCSRCNDKQIQLV